MRHGDMPAAFITMISESVASLLSVWPTATTSAIGAITRTSIGMIRLVMPMNTRMVWPWLVIRSMSRNACVSQMTAVRLSKTSRNAPNVVRKIYRSNAPIGRQHPQFPATQRPPTHCSKTLPGIDGKTGAGTSQPADDGVWNAENHLFLAPDRRFLAQCDMKGSVPWRTPGNSTLAR